MDGSTAAGFDDLANHYGLVAADFTGNGALDVAIFGSEGTPRLHANHCGGGAWLAVELRGREENTEGFGAVVTVEAAGRRHRRTLHSLRALGQGPSRLHFGLGEVDEVDAVEVRWPTGAEQRVEAVPVRGILTLRE